jgi:hypothetical protein
MFGDSIWQSDRDRSVHGGSNLRILSKIDSISTENNNKRRGEIRNIPPRLESARRQVRRSSPI